ncbi:hypothetical protein HDU81_002348 [Chytriomyces hyalinus]|nr:hypothetical protein HDU81_002348 [Chytriomyces hyalinus]
MIQVFWKLLLTLFLTAALADVQDEPLPSLRMQQRIQSEWVHARTNDIIPALLTEHKVDMWILSMREYNEDPVFWGLVTRATTFAARRRTVYIFSNKGGEFKQWRFIDNTDQVWADLVKVLYEVDPLSIAVDIDASGNNFADGLHTGESERLLKSLPWAYWIRIQRVPLLATQFLATRPKGMLDMYKRIMGTAHAIIREGFSGNVITPGKTTTEDLQWWFRDRIQSLNMTTWFHPSVDVQRFDPVSGKVIAFANEDVTIEKGDLIWTDFGVTFMGLNTDTQHNGYVLRDGETDAPEGLRNGLTRHSNLMQDILMREINTTLTGNEVLKIAHEEMAALNINGTIYCHPIGDYGHAAGSLIGMTNLQDGVPVLGDIPIFPHMWYSIELQATVPVPEWNAQQVNFRQEEDMYLDADGAPRWVVGRQSELHLVGAPGQIEQHVQVQEAGKQVGAAQILFQE